jgi:pimeloyl-ACP methyl ester carboxylesterase
MTEWQSRIVQLGAVSLSVREAGEGAPLLILHDELGPPGWQAWHAELAKSRRLILPIIPGFVGERLKWARGVRDVAVLFGQLLRELGHGPVDAIGLSFGGWVAAEMAVQNPVQFRKLALVAPFGLKPAHGVIADMFLTTSAEYIRAGFADPATVEEFATLYGDARPETIEGWEDARIECAQLGWQPYMHEPAMEPLLSAAGELPALVLWGDRDVIVPEPAMRAYAQGLANARLHVMHGCGHRPELERPMAFVATVGDFLGADALETA